MDEIDVECASANQLQASAIPSIMRKLLFVDPEESETDNSSENPCHQISNVFDALRRQEEWPYNDGSK